MNISDFLRMYPALFDEILCLIENDVTIEYTVFRDPMNMLTSR